jgi:hypothetical protein
VNTSAVKEKENRKQKTIKRKRIMEGARGSLE